MPEYINITGGSLLGVVIIGVIIFSRRKTRKLDKRYFKRRWQKLQKQCVDKKLWYQAIIDADELLDEALSELHFKGKTTGERLVSAQRQFSANDAVWFSHKLKNRIVEENFKKLTKAQTLDALATYRQALKDVGALAADRKAKAANGK